MTVKRSVLAVVLAVALAVAFGCSGSDDLADPTVVTSTTAIADPTTSTTEAPSATSGVVVTQPPDADGTSGPATTDDPPASSTPAVSIVDVPETGVPGLDSDDRFCAAWSRFGGSWQVLLVGSTFLEDPQRVAAWEIAAATVVGDAYDGLVASFPEELADEADLVADGYFGVLDRRAADARQALADAGATADDVARLQEAWVEALATRDPSTPDLAFEIPAGLEPLVAEAAADLRERRVEIHVDPSMIVDVATPRTDSYLETTCPDQGTLSGQEIDPVEGG